jgi:diaminopimelate epimerase
MNERVPFAKMSGSGNDFVVIDNRSGPIPAGSAGEFARRVCRHRLSVGADGIVLIEPPTDSMTHFRWRYVNADGSDGEMCGNGAMCGARFAYLQGIAPARCVFETASGLVRAEVDASSPRVALTMADPGPIRPDLEVEAAGQAVRIHAVEVGVPHAVIVTADADRFAPGTELLVLGRAIRHHPAFAPAGTNVNLISVQGIDRLRMRTYERGVEDETLACGTGAVASAVVATSLGLAAPPVEVVTSSGRVLHVGFAWDGARATDVRLVGEARVIATGEIWPEALG